METVVIIYIIVGVVLGSFKLVKALKANQWGSNAMKIDAIICIAYWPVMLWFEACFGKSYTQPQKKRKRRTKDEYDK